MQLFNQLPPKKVLPTAIADKLMDELNPFDDIAETNHCWSELGCHLIVIDAWDKPDCINCLSDTLKRELKHTLEYPEYVDGHGHYKLLLSIAADDGRGMYLLISNSICFDAVKEVLNEPKHL